MSPNEVSFPPRASGTCAGGSSTEWQILALDTLARLTRQFALHPDCTKLIDLVLLSMTGQLSTTGACALFFASLTDRQSTVFRGSGLLHNREEFRVLLDSSDLRQLLADRAAPLRIADLSSYPAMPSQITEMLIESRVTAIVPMLIGDSLLGVLGLAGKVDRSEFSDDDLSLLGTLADTIAPLLSNSLLHAKMNSLNRWLRDVMDSVRQGVLVFGNNLQLKQANASACELLVALGVQIDGEQTLLTKDALFDERVFPGWLPFIDAVVVGTETRHTETLVVRNGGEDRVFLVRVSRTSGAAFEESDTVVTFDEITQQRDNERRMFEMEKFAEKGVMAASIAHELNNYLALILGGLELAQIAIERKDFEKTGLSLEKLKKHSIAMERFTAGLVDYSRLNSEETPADLNAIVKDVVSFARVQKRFNGIHLGTDLAKNIPEIKVDVDQIAQLLMNLLNNAADAIRDGQSGNGLIEVITGFEGSWVSLRIRDNGIGIPEHLKDKLFRERFTTKVDGHGFGMVTCGHILKQHRARHRVDSTPGQGSTIMIEFPIPSSIA